VQRALKFLGVVVFLAVVLAALAFLLYTGFGKYPPRGMRMAVSRDERSARVDTGAAERPGPAASAADVPLVPEAEISEPEPVLPIEEMDSLGDPRFAELIDLRTRAGEWPQALSLCRELLEEHPGDRGIRIRLAAILLTLGHVNEAYGESVALLEANPDDRQAHMVLAQTALRAGLPSLAVSHARRATELSPRMIEPRRLLAIALLGEGSRELAKDELESLLQVRPDDVELLTNLGSVYGQLGMADRARVALDKAIELNPDSASTHMALAQFLLGSGNIVGAMASYRAVLERAPAHAMALNNLAALLGEQDDGVKEGLELATRAWQVSPGTPQIADTLGWLLYKAGEAERATSILAFAVQRGPDEPTFRYHLAVVLHERGKPAEAEKQLRKALASGLTFPEQDDARRLLEQLQGTP
jgi:Flp pilus assembly protein TadD